MWVRTNPNPKHKHVPDCVIRALAIVLDKTWYQVYDDLYLVGRWECSVSCHDDVWGAYLHMQGYEQFMLPEACPRCITIKEFTRYFPKGRYVIGTGSHAVAVIDGDYYDSWDSGDENPLIYLRGAGCGPCGIADYEVEWSGNIAVPTGSTVGEI